MKLHSSVPRLLGMLLMTLSLLACGGGGGGGGPVATPEDPQPTPATRQWTYLVYMGGDNNLSAAALADINEMETVGSSADVAVVVQAEFSSQYTPGVPTDTRRILVQNDHNLNDVDLSGTSIGNVNMADPAQLTAFINWAKTNYPAQHYALVIWDHGSGWKASSFAVTSKGAVLDETSGSFMSLPELSKGVGDAGLHFDVIDFDACLMAMYEVAYEFRATTDYMTFSEETEPGNGDPYDLILDALAGNPAMDGRTLARTIVDQYHLSYQADSRESTTKSAVDMAQIDALDAKIVTLAGQLQGDSGSTGVVQYAQANAQSYTYPANHDLYEFCKSLNANLATGAAKTTCGDIMTLLNSVVIDSQWSDSTDPSQPSVGNSHGLAIYIPQPTETNPTELAQYELLKCNLASRASASGTWGAYVEALTGGGTLQTGTGSYAIYLYWTNTSGSDCNADLDLYVFEPDGNWYSPWMGQTTPNGLFSQESSQSGVSEEYYLANPQVMQGEYDFLVNYYADGSNCNQAMAHILIQDANYFGDSLWHELFAPSVMDLFTNPYSGAGCSTADCIDSYSDWWVPGYTVRAIDGVSFQAGRDLPIDSRTSKLVSRRRDVLLPSLAP